MSFLSNHRLHWGEHDALTGHFLTHLEVMIHDLPLAHAEAVPPAAATGENVVPSAPGASGDGMPPSAGLADIPGP